jgi:hypothetical protein
MLSIMLCNTPFQPLGYPDNRLPPLPSFAKDSPPPQEPHSDAEIALPLHTLGSFDLSSMSLSVTLPLLLSKAIILRSERLPPWHVANFSFTIPTHYLGPPLFWKNPKRKLHFEDNDLIRPPRPAKGPWQNTRRELLSCPAIELNYISWPPLRIAGKRSLPSKTQVLFNTS